MSDEFARLRAIAAAQEADVKKWKYERDGNVMGTIVDFSSMKNKTFGEQQTVVVKLADTGELVSAFLNDYLVLEREPISQYKTISCDTIRL